MNRILVNWFDELEMHFRGIRISVKLVYDRQIQPEGFHFYVIKIKTVHEGFMALIPD